MTNTPPVHVVFNAMSIRPGGGLTVLLGLIKGLASQDQIKVNTTVVCSANGTYDALLEQGIAKVEQPLKNASGIKRQIWAVTRLGGLVKELKADVFVSVNQFIRGVSCPQVIYHVNVLRFMPVRANGSVTHFIAEHLRNYSALQALRKASANVFESAFIQDCAETFHDRNDPLDQVIYIGLPDYLVNASKTEARYTAGQLFAITSSEPHKDNSTMIRTLAELVKLRTEVDWRLKIAGFDDTWSDYKTLARSLDVLDRIQWLGFLTQAEITIHLRESLSLISTSKVESFCMVALEAMARGCPPVVSDCSAMPESVGEGGLLAKPGDPKSFAQAVLSLHDSPDLRNQYVEKGFEHVRSFRWNTCGEQFVELFSQLCHNPK